MVIVVEIEKNDYIAVGLGNSGNRSVGVVFISKDVPIQQPGGFAFQLCVENPDADGVCVQRNRKKYEYQIGTEAESSSSTVSAARLVAIICATRLSATPRIIMPDGKNAHPEITQIII